MPLRHRHRRPAAAASASGPTIADTARVAALPGGDLPYTLRRSPRATRLRVTVHPEHGVVVSLPAGRPIGQAIESADRFLGEREAWVRGHLGRLATRRDALAARPALDDGRLIPYLGVPHRVRVIPAPPGLRTSRVSRIGDDGDELLVERASRDRRPTARILEAWLRARARECLTAAIDRHAGAMGVTPGTMTLRDPRTRWGSCSRRGALSFSWRLVLAPPEALETVAVHELCHLKVFGHGPRFVALLAGRRPDHAAWRRWLRLHAHELHLALA
jgi:predicted metal-dependent hydrolase